MANMGTGNGVRADIALDSLSKEMQDLIGSLDNDLQLETADIETIKEQLRKVAEDAKKRGPSKP